MKKPELKIFTFYSLVAKEVDLKTEDVDLIHSWFIKKLISETKNNEALSIHVAGLGRLYVRKKRIVHMILYHTERIQHFGTKEVPTEFLRQIDFSASLILRGLNLFKRLKEHKPEAYDKVREKRFLDALESLECIKDLEFDKEKYPNLKKLQEHEYSI